MPLDALPAELWLRIASYVPDEDLHSLSAVSRFFRWVQTDRRYKHLVLDDDRPKRLEATLGRLRNESDVRTLVQSIAVYPRAIRSACLRSSKQKSHLGTAGPRSPAAPSSFRAQMENPAAREDFALADRIVDSLAGLPNVSELDVDWERPTTDEAAFCVPMLKALVHSVGSQLTSLSLSMALDVLSSFVSSIQDPPPIRTLRLNLGSNMDDPESMEDADKHQEALATFVNSLASTLQSLSLTCKWHCRLCTLFHHLHTFPHLRSLRLHIPFDPHHLDGTQGVNRFLRTHAPCLAHLEFTPIHCCNRPHALRDSVTTRLNSDEWLHDVFASVELRNLRTLDLGLNPTIGGAPRVLPAIAYFGHAVGGNLGCLTITGVVMSVEDLGAILQPFAETGKSAPKMVVLEVNVLSREVVEALTGALAGLEVLDLTYRWVITAGNRDAALFISDVKRKWYEQWKLRRIWVRASAGDGKGAGRRAETHVAMPNRVPRL
ncbi:hypothetical protein NMY22_g428 [Coprinellus aureogranulatus]|nr:hypothetical protein NMY22_g428 [Coprinellus aureogranulatus]